MASSGRRGILFLVAAIATGLTTLIATQGAAVGAYTTTLYSLHMGSGRYVDNYDYNSKSAWSDNVDWPVTLLFYNNATIGKVKSALDPWYPVSATSLGRKNSRLSDGYGYVWDEDGGKKTTGPGCGTKANHYRIYADSDDRMYSTTFGYFVYATTHIDENDTCWYGEKFYGSEDTEYNIALKTRWAISWPTYHDYGWFYNAQQGVDRLESNHTWQSNGYATYVWVP